MSEIKQRNPELVLISSSARRADFLRVLSENLKTYEGGPEEDTPNVVKIAYQKIRYALEQNPGLEEKVKAGTTEVFAADVRTEIARLDEKGELTYKSFGKPKSIDEIREHFQEMLAAQSKHGQAAYRVRTGTTHLHKGGYSARQELCYFLFTENALQALNTEEGFAAYLAKYAQIHGDVENITISGGISFETLASLGHVDRAIFGKNTEDGKEMNFVQQLEDAIQAVMLHAGVGISPELIKKLIKRLSLSYEELMVTMKDFAWVQAAIAAATPQPDVAQATA